MLLSVFFSLSLFIFGWRGSHSAPMCPNRNNDQRDAVDLLLKDCQALKERDECLRRDQNFELSALILVRGGNGRSRILNAYMNDCIPIFLVLLKGRQSAADRQIVGSRKKNRFFSCNLDERNFSIKPIDPRRHFIPH